MAWELVKVEDMVGALLLEIREGCDTFVTTKGIFWFSHMQDCCEHVDLVDVNQNGVGVGEVISTADERVSYPDVFERNDDSETWTFYTIRTQSMDLDLRWVGSSNGYYSESVDVCCSPLTKSDIRNLSPAASVALDAWLESGGSVNLATERRLDWIKHDN